MLSALSLLERASCVLAPVKVRQIACGVIEREQELCPLIYAAEKFALVARLTTNPIPVDLICRQELK